MIHRLFGKSRPPLPIVVWDEARHRVPLLSTLNANEAEHLGQRAWEFLHHKRITLHPELSGTTFDAAAQMTLAGQACLLTLGWNQAEHNEAFVNVHEIFILPDGFTRDVEEMDEFGIVHRFQDSRAGETSYQGPVVLSFTDLMASGSFNGFNVLIHELAHKLDMGNSMDIDGFPPLPKHITPHTWHRTFSAVWADLIQRTEKGLPTAIDNYAASHPGECFAVGCEYFFAAPRTLADAYPALYDLLCQYFNQTPLARWDKARLS
ncbi:zinc-dependent peptidase [Vreelandella olivaria]|uniref:M90 family metallopeptidase n=1 Tax=Vreelandella olivaria TaxID=390919 RepID=UPI00201E7D57|nr:M90 family metallopeptidase [Halomonas olivaria]